MGTAVGQLRIGPCANRDIAVEQIAYALCTPNHSLRIVCRCYAIVALLRALCALSIDFVLSG